MSCTTPEIKALDCNGKELQVGDTVVVKSVCGSQKVADRFSVGDLVTITEFTRIGWGGGPIVRVEGMGTGQYATRYEFHSRPACCTLQEAADLLEEAGVLVDHATLERAINPRPKTLPCKRIRIRDKRSGDVCILAQTGPRQYQIFGSDHNRYSEAQELTSGMSAVDLDELEEKLLIGWGLELLDTWSADTEFPELLES